MNNKILPAFGALGLAVLLTGCSLFGGDQVDLEPDADLDAALIEASSVGDLGQVKDLVARGAQVNSEATSGDALNAALVANHPQVVVWLLSQGAEPSGSAATASPIWLAASRGDSNLVKQLVQLGANVNEAGNKSSSPLLAAAMGGHFQTAKILVRSGADVNTRMDGKSLLMLVVENNDLLMAEMLIAAGADVNYAGDQGQTALDIAKQKRFRDLEMLLVQYGS